MKTCHVCRLYFEDDQENCPDCHVRLTMVNDPFETDGLRARDTYDRAGTRTGHPFTEPVDHKPADREPPFITEDGNGVTVRGIVREVQPQQFYQSRTTRMVRALLFGEPYQMSHTAFNHRIRVEEHRDTGYPEREEDLMIFGNVIKL